MTRISAGVTPIAKGHFICSIDRSSVGKTAQVMSLKHTSLLHSREFTQGKRLLTDMVLPECQPNRKFGPVLMYENIPAPPHQYIGWAIVPGEIGELRIVLLLSHGYFACYEGHSDAENDVRRGACESKLQRRREEKEDFTAWGSQPW